MKRVIPSITAAAAFALSVSAFSTTPSAQTLSAQVNQLSIETQQLQHEVWLLKQKEKKSARKKHKKAKKQEQKAVVNSVLPVNYTQPLEFDKSDQSPQIIKMWPHYVTVTTVPFQKRHLSYSGSDLLYNTSSINEDLLLLQKKGKVLNAMEAAHYTLHRPILQLSGSVQGQAYSSGSFSTNSANGGATSGITLSTAELDLNAIASSWADAFMALSFSGSPVSVGNRAPNSEIYLERGFLTIGDLNKVPIYFTIGEMYAPFGAYTSSMVTTPETQSMMEIRTPVALLGFSKNNFMAAIYDYEGSQTSSGAKLLQQGGVEAGYINRFGSEKANSIKVGAGYVTNIADSQGMQGTGYSTVNGQFGGFGATATSNQLVHAVGGIDGNATLVLGRITLIGEYIVAASSFSPFDLTYDGHGAQPTAGHAEIDYNLPFFSKKYGVALGTSFDQASQALGLNLEQNKYAVFLNANLWRETVESIEYDYQKDYAAENNSIGRGATAFILGTGRGVNTVIGQVGVYF